MFQVAVAFETPRAVVPARQPDMLELEIGEEPDRGNRRGQDERMNGPGQRCKEIEKRCCDEEARDAHGRPERRPDALPAERAARKRDQPLYAAIRARLEVGRLR